MVICVQTTLSQLQVLISEINFNIPLDKKLLFGRLDQLKVLGPYQN